MNEYERRKSAGTFLIPQPEGAAPAVKGLKGRDTVDRPGSLEQYGRLDLIIFDVMYAMLKGARLGVPGKEYAAKDLKTFNGISEKYLSFSDGELQLGDICLVAGLGSADNTRRDGSYEYYISEPVVSSDAKGSAPYLPRCTEIERVMRQSGTA